MKSFQFGWCLHCERAFEVPLGMTLEETAVDLDSDVECPFSDCDGMIWDLWTWEEFRENDSTLPVSPVHGVEYPMYPTKERRAA